MQWKSLCSIQAEYIGHWKSADQIKFGIKGWVVGRYCWVLRYCSNSSACQSQLPSVETWYECTLRITSVRSKVTQLIYRHRGTVSLVVYKSPGPMDVCVPVNWRIVSDYVQIRWYRKSAGEQCNDILCHSVYMKSFDINLHGLGESVGTVYLVTESLFLYICTLTQYARCYSVRCCSTSTRL